MSTIVAALLAGTAAAGGAAIWAGSSTSTKVPSAQEAVKEASGQEQIAPVPDSAKEPEEDEPAPPAEAPQPQPITPPPEPAPEPAPEPPQAQPITPPPEPVDEEMQGGSRQEGGFGKPTWSPLNSGQSLQSAMRLTKEQIGSTGSSIIAQLTGVKTPESIQLKLVEIDTELRKLRSSEFIDKSKLEQLKLDFLTKPDTPDIIRLKTEIKTLEEQKVLGQADLTAKTETLIGAWADWSADITFLAGDCNTGTALADIPSEYENLYFPNTVRLNLIAFLTADSSSDSALAA